MDKIFVIPGITVFDFVEAVVLFVSAMAVLVVFKGRRLLVRVFAMVGFGLYWLGTVGPSRPFQVKGLASLLFITILIFGLWIWGNSLSDSR